MVTKLGRKQSSNNDDWLEVLGNIWDYVSLDELKEYIYKAFFEMSEVLSMYSKPAVAWSGGKDSVVMYDLIKHLTGHMPGVFASYGELEFPAFVSWANTATPPEVITYINPKLTMSWLANNDQYLFPAQSKLGYFWTQNGTHWAQEQYQKEHNPDVLFLGRRVADGNYINGDPPYDIHSNHKGITAYSPLRDWPHEVLLAYIVEYSLDLPPTYSWPNGFTTGTGPWCGRQGFQSKMDGWIATYAADPTVVRAAAEYFPEAAYLLTMVDEE